MEVTLWLGNILVIWSMRWTPQSSIIPPPATAYSRYPGCPGAGNAGFNLKYVAQQAGFNGLPHMEIVGIVAAVLMDREHAAGALGAVDHFLGFFAGHGYRLSHSTALPASSAWQTSGMWKLLGVATTTMSISYRLRGLIES